MHRDRGTHRDTETQEDSHVKMKTETGVMLPQVRECLEPLEVRRGKEETSQRAFRRNMALADTLI